MNKKVNIVLITLTALFFTLVTHAQDKIIHGVVPTFDSIPLVDAEIKNRSTKQTVTTDSIGRFTLPAASGDKLRIKARGFFNEKAKIEDKTRYVAVNMKLKPGQRNKEYAIGYTKVSDRDKLNALATMSNEGLDFS